MEGFKISITEWIKKLPLINSSNKGIRVTGYVILFVLAFFAVLGVILPAPNTATSENASGDKTLSSDENWTSQVLFNSALMSVYEADGSKALAAYDTIVSTQTYSGMKNAAENALSESKASNVSAKYATAKSIYESGLEEYISGSSAALRFIESSNQQMGLRLLESSTNALADADKLMSDTEAELNKVDPDWKDAYIKQNS